ncbi:hypothetical protein GALMADRAFT_251585 [Galerina marginata CBS 339.88]|uniref:Uncharacterized protein n=1 Tax=Galerina marginata (strain CBS 339.88) TaxID=685588 RepID=A0A067SUN4_GALM3|nr:hypothetical protein GALMADRAFT_251585 [Galerina marginata CBS 339.88]
MSCQSPSTGERSGQIQFKTIFYKDGEIAFRIQGPIVSVPPGPGQCYTCSLDYFNYCIKYSQQLNLYGFNPEEWPLPVGYEILAKIFNLEPHFHGKLALPPTSGKAGDAPRETGKFFSFEEVFPKEMLAKIGTEGPPQPARLENQVRRDFPESKNSADSELNCKTFKGKADMPLPGSEQKRMEPGEWKKARKEHFKAKKSDEKFARKMGETPRQQTGKSKGAENMGKQGRKTVSSSSSRLNTPRFDTPPNTLSKTNSGAGLPTALIPPIASMAPSTTTASTVPTFASSSFGQVRVPRASTPPSENVVDVEGKIVSGPDAAGDIEMGDASEKPTETPGEPSAKADEKAAEE